ncbi:MAG: DUF1080 domain-containing protein [Gemmataceae bacterium]|nr:DUF1080 domain-containing protein [Gemmataceae bacterium]
MRRLLAPAAVVLLIGVTPADDREGFTPLFNGKDLAGWRTFGRKEKDGPTAAIDSKDSWSVVDGELRCTGKPTGYLVTEKEYGDYVLRLKWRYPKDLKAGNSGVLVHCQKGDTVWPVCIEVQLRSGRAGDLWLQTAAEVKLEVPADRRDAADKTNRHIWRSPKDEAVEKPFGEWNRYEITCRGGDITVAVNGRVVNGGTKGNLTKGRIALQSEGTEIHFKDIEIKPVK